MREIDDSYKFPFGKYAGKPLYDVMSDGGYCEWLMEQDWFKDKFPVLCKYILENYEDYYDPDDPNEEIYYG